MGTLTEIVIFSRDALTGVGSSLPTETRCNTPNSIASILVSPKLRRSGYLLNNNNEFRIQAEFIVVDPGLILNNAQLLIRDGRIVEVCQSPSLPPDLYLPNSTLLPGFINSHTHLEFSDLAESFPAGPNFPSWIAAVVKHRRQQLGSLDADSLLRLRQKVISTGLAECLRWGTAAVVDVVTSPWSLEQLSAADSRESQPVNSSKYPQIIALPEILGLDRARFQQSLDWANELLNTTADATGSEATGSPLVASLGLSPHAPYSLIHPEAITSLKDFHPQAMMAVHVAESLEEREWLEQGCGPFRELYERIGLPTAAPRMQIAEAIELLASRPRGLLIHGNYLLESELDRIAQTNTAIVYCPRTHQHFGHNDYPLQSMLERSIPVVLGTDSRASNPDLSIWRECCRARQMHSTLWSSADALAAITTVPARVLGIESDLGSLHPGRQAFLNSVSTPAGATAQSLLEQLINADAMHPQPCGSRHGLAVN
jgi:aminodeoxyfutalosine deaminase